MGLTESLQQLKAAYAAKDWAACVRLVPATKLALMGNHGTAPLEQLLGIAREILEIAVEASVQLHDESAFERNFQQLRQHYTDTRKLLPNSPNEPALTGLNLLRLLVQNRIAEFHTELEVIPVVAQAGQEVAFIVQLEQWLMEGAYNRVLAARTSVPVALYAWFMERLSSTVRDEVAGCSERAYPSLKLVDAQRLLLFSSEQEAAAFAEDRGWEVRDGRVYFQVPEQGGVNDINALELISNSMTYARELERIV